MGITNLPPELLRDIVDCISPPSWKWNESRFQTGWFLSLRLISSSFDSAVIDCFLSAIKANLDFGELPLVRYLVTPSSVQMCKRLLAEQVYRDGAGSDNYLIDMIIRSVSKVVDLLQGHHSDLSTLRRSYLGGMIYTVVGFAGVYAPLAHLSGKKVAEEGDGFNEGDCLHVSLAVAAGLGRIPDMKHLIELGADVNFDKNEGWVGNAFHAAAIGGHVDALQFLLDQGVDPQKRGVGNADTSLHYAATSGHGFVVEFLLGLGVDADPHNNDNETPLLCAAAAGHENITQRLLQCKTDVNQKDDYGKAPLIYAVRRRHERVVEALLGREDINPECIDPDELNASSLAMAAALGDEGIVNLLLSHPKVNIHAKDACNHTILKHAVTGGNEAIVRSVLALPGMDVNARGRDDGSTPLLWAVQGGNPSLVRLLLAQESIDVNVTTLSGATPLLKAAGSENLNVVKALLEHKDLDINFVHMESDWSQTSVLGLVAGVGMVETAKVLLQHPGINPELEDMWGRTPLSRAAIYNHPSIIQLLLARDDVNVNAADGSGYTALMHAAKHGNIAALNVLLQDPNIQVGLKSHTNKTALALAAANGEYKAARSLLEPNLGFTKEAIKYSMSVAGKKGHKALGIYLRDILTNSANVLDLLGRNV
ncbi:ankyrin repeat-containing domain protein [Aspergillus cavernicola]|uniref:Ankyrin repeat-containing domain protein n=1 Tax=Aspergillus cavernicola TaxID=176166 RepID=A0ABR4IXW5_9EURO